MEVHGFGQGDAFLSCIWEWRVCGGRGRAGRVSSEPFSLQFNLAMAQERTDGWLTEAAGMGTALGLHSPVLQHCMHVLEEFRSLLPLLSKLGSLQLQNLDFQALLRGRCGQSQSRS